MKTLGNIVIILAFLVAGTVITILLIARHRKLDVTRNTSERMYEPKETTLNFPLLISMNDIEKLANNRIRPVLLDKPIPMKNGRDTLILKVTRLGDIAINLRGSVFKASVPLKLEVQFIKSVLGKTNVQLFKEKPLTFLFEASLESAFTLTENTRLKTITRLKEIRWLEEPNVKVLGFDINLKDKIDELIHEKAPEITNRLDDLMMAKIDIKTPTVKIWENVQKPIQATKKQKDLFVRIQPRTLGVHVDKSMNDSLRLDLIITSKVYVRFAQDTAAIEKTPFPKKIELITKEDTYESSKLYLHCLFPMRKLNAILRRELEGKQFRVQGFDLSIQKIYITNGVQDIFVRVKHGGTIEGTVIMRGLPEFSKEDQKISIKHISFENQLKDGVINTMTDLLHDQLTSIIRQYATFDIGELMQSIPDYARKAIKKSKLSKTTEIELEELGVEDLEIQLTRYNIQVLVGGQGDFGISLKRDSFKALRKKH